ncbi:MAG: hypothetical protein ABEH83_05985 [Halobacterium sp.]
MERPGALSFDAASLLVPAIGFGVGALLAGSAALTAWSNAYMNANPAVGSVSGGSTLTVAALFVAGTAVMFLAACAALDEILRTAR